MNHNRLAAFRWLMFVSYLAIFYASLFLTIPLRYGHPINGAYLWRHIVVFSGVYAVWMVVFYVHNLFEISTLRRLQQLLLSLASALAVSLLSATVYFYFQPGLILTPRRFLLLHVVITGVLVLAWQALIRYFVTHHVMERIFVLDWGEEAKAYVGELKQYRFLGLHFMGPVSGTQAEALTINPPASLVLPASGKISQTIMKQVYPLRLRGVTFYNRRNLYESLTRKIYLPTLDESWFLENITYHPRRLYGFLKRGVDILAGLLGTIVLLFLYLPVAFAIVLESRGPSLFTQPRVGQYGTIFTAYKFRTMRSGQPTNTWTGKSDSRITKIGRFLRRTRLDELPQSLNLLRGEMSLVGPRPEQPHIVEQLCQQIPFYDERHLVKPGLTGWGQLNVYARSVEESKVKLQYDLYYIKHRSLLFDAEIILKTLYHVLTATDA